MINTNQKLLALLDDQTLALPIFEEVAQQYDHDTSNFALLYFQAHEFLQLSINYSKTRIVHSKPIINLAPIQEKIKYATAVLGIYKSALIGNADKKNLAIFTSQVLLEALERLLQIHGANGYMEDSLCTKLWSDCYARISDIVRIYER